MSWHRPKVKVPWPGTDLKSRYHDPAQSSEVKVPRPGTDLKSRYCDLAQSSEVKVPWPGTDLKSRYCDLAQSSEVKVPWPGTDLKSRYCDLAQSSEVNVPWPGTQQFSSTFPTVTPALRVLVQIYVNLKWCLRQSLRCQLLLLTSKCAEWKCSMSLEINSFKPCLISKCSCPKWTKNKQLDKHSSLGKSISYWYKSKLITRHRQPA